MVTYILSTGIIPLGAFGAYAYTEATPGELKTAMEGPHTSYIDYILVVELLEEWTGVRDKWSKELSPGLKPDEVAFIVRPKPHNPPGESIWAHHSHNITDWEISRLKRLA